MLRRVRVRRRWQRVPVACFGRGTRVGHTRVDCRARSRGLPMSFQKGGNSPGLQFSSTLMGCGEVVGMVFRRFAERDCWV